MGICLSGGGIRSASVATGVLRKLFFDGVKGRFEEELLPEAISTVSGGGYVGSSLTQWLHRARTSASEANPFDFNREMEEYFLNFRRNVGYHVNFHANSSMLDKTHTCCRGFLDLFAVAVVMGLWIVLVLATLMPLAFPAALVIREYLGVVRINSDIVLNPFSDRRFYPAVLFLAGLIGELGRLTQGALI